MVSNWAKRSPPKRIRNERENFVREPLGSRLLGLALLHAFIANSHGHASIALRKSRHLSPFFAP